MKIKLKAHEIQDSLTQFYEQDFFVFRPFDDILTNFCSVLSDHLFKQKDYPDFAALAFWMRKGQLENLKKQFYARKRSHNYFAPCGLVFHIPPAHIEAMFLYSWLTSLLAGNGNILRLPQERSPRFETLLLKIEELLNESRFRPIKERTRFVEYGHEEAITASLSEHAAVRVIWGGDETIRKIRGIPLNPRARELTFPDRFSYSIIDAKAYLELPDGEKEILSSYFYQDVYNFDQSACSSPRLLYWVGDSDLIKLASDRFYSDLQQTLVDKAHEISLGGFLLKQTYVYNQALDLPANEVLQFSNELTILKVTVPSNACRLHPGQGFLYHVELAHFKEMIPFITSQDQTLTYFGLSNEELEELALSINGRGITRIVPIGQALNFETVWDGVDLFALLTQEGVIL